MTHLALGFPRLSGIVEEVGYLVARFVAVPVAVFAEHGIQFGDVFFFSTHTFHQSVYIMGSIPSIVAGSSFGDEAGEGKSVTGIAEETAVPHLPGVRSPVSAPAIHERIAPSELLLTVE